MKKVIIASIVIAAIAAISIGLELNSSYVYATLNDWKLIPQKEHFTELYFVTYPTLDPSNVVVGTKIPFSFELHNVEEKDTDYPFMVYFKGSDNRTALIDRGVLTIKDGGTELKTESYTMGKAGLSGNVIVYLTDLDRYIYFSVPNKNLVLDQQQADEARARILRATSTPPAAAQ